MLAVRAPVGANNIAGSRVDKSCQEVVEPTLADEANPGAVLA